MVKKNGTFNGIHFDSNKKLERKRQRYFCDNCEKSFSKTSKYTYSKKLIDDLVERYVSGKSSYRDLARNSGASKGEINTWISAYAKNSKTTIDLAKKFNFNWTGYLTADGKMIKFRGRKGCLYIGVDNCGDIVHILFADSPENKTYWCKFFRELKDGISYPLIALICDGKDDILRACELAYQDFIHQTCIQHFGKRINRMFGFLTVKRNKEKRKEFRREIEFRNDINFLLHQKTSADFIARYKKLIQKFETDYNTGHCRKMIELVDENPFSLAAHYYDNNIPRTNNMAETTIKQYERRLKTMEGFQSQETSKNFLNLFTIFLRCKKYTDCKKENKYKNGNNRVGLAGVEIEEKNWLKISQN